MIIFLVFPKLMEVMIMFLVYRKLMEAMIKFLVYPKLKETMIMFLVYRRLKMMIIFLENFQIIRTIHKIMFLENFQIIQTMVENLILRFHPKNWSLILRWMMMNYLIKSANLRILYLERMTSQKNQFNLQLYILVTIAEMMT